ncbi:hypothetical protein DSM106972_022190 [Dulcicalothrix desertica PCC 7102]|uniref:Uncharacterized protein n=1 Tax=Dulcicalothrix desertica PCC 7102 TaxID=232991 RepID=A0A433VPD5_9CYAN|nr:hypothetical protein [Dulcicalothrix desertica]RUT07959.1 hypothetical protein DSM106972_022190 [Dulcicalothrix desertica PCC 7102]TWH39480.1 hypothetical protein CAL7102_08715 [Dulcicalothrix desertica PCC 7102]
MAPIKTFILSLIGTTLTGLVISAFDLAIAQKPPVQKQYCKTWQDVKSQIQMIYMGSVGASVVPDMPKRFQNGCVYGDHGAYTISLYVLKDDFKPTNIRLDNEILLDSSIPRINGADPNIERQIKRGNILHFFNVCASTGTASFCKGIPKNTSYSKDGLTCLNNLCIQAINVPETELITIWNNAKK